MTNIPGKGTVLKKGATAETTTAIANCLNVEPPDRKIETQDVTPLDGVAVEKAASIPDNGEWGSDLLLDRTAHDALLTDFEAGTMRFWDVEYSDGWIDSFQGFISSYKETKIDAKVAAVTAAIKIMVSGAIVRTESE